MVDLSDPSVLALQAQIGKTAQAAGGIDSGLVVILGALLAPIPSAGFALEMASIFVYSARSIDQRIEIVNKAFDLQFKNEFLLRRHDNPRRAIEFIKKLKGIIISTATESLWIRNLSAHGSLDLSSDRPYLIGQYFDFDQRSRIAKRLGEENAKISAEQLAEYTAPLSTAANRLGKIGMCIKSYRQLFPAAPHIFLAEANSLAREMNLAPLHLQDPNEGPPKRQRRPKRGG